MASNTAEQQTGIVDASSIKEPGHNFDMNKFDVTLPHEMNLKQFDFNSDELTFSEDQLCQTESNKSLDYSHTLKTSDNFLKKFDLFYQDMKSRLNLLKNSPVISSKSDVIPVSSQESLTVNEKEKLFKKLKNTPEVQEKLQYIQELDDEIVSIISDYKNEREQRLQTQKELCNDICKNNAFPERDTQSFLDMCDFEVTDRDENNDLIDDLVDKDIKTIISRTVKSTNKYVIRNTPDTFIKRNIELAKNGMSVGSSLTDEEKSRIDILLNTDPKNFSQSSENLTESFAADLDDNRSSTMNAYSLLALEKEKLDDIDGKLEKFTEDEKEKEKLVENSRDFSDEFLVKQALKKINEQLKELRSIDEKELESKQLIYSKKMEKIDEEIKNLEDEEEQLLRAENLDMLDDLLKKIKSDAFTANPNEIQNETDEEEESNEERTLREISFSSSKKKDCAEK